MLALPVLKTNKQQEQQQQNPLQVTLPLIARSGHPFYESSGFWESLSLPRVLAGSWQWGLGSSEKGKGAAPLYTWAWKAFSQEVASDLELLSTTHLWGVVPHKQLTALPWPPGPSLAPAPTQPLARQGSGPGICRKPGSGSYLYLYFKSSHLWRAHLKPVILPGILHYYLM